MLLEKGDFYWEGTPEKCDECGETYPMCWIIWDGEKFLCFHCYYNGVVAE